MAWKLKDLKENNNLRLASFLIGFLCLVFEVIWLFLSSLMAWVLTDRHITEAHPVGYVYMQRFLLFLFMLIVCFEILLCVALLIGLRKRLPDHLQMWYMGFMLCLVVRTPVTIIVTTKEFYGYNTKWFWFITVEILLETLVTLCFIYVVRCYYLRMIMETNYYQNLNYAQANMQGQILYSDKSGMLNNDPKKVKFFSPDENDVHDIRGMDMGSPQYVNLEKGNMSPPVYNEGAPKLPLVDIHEKQDSSMYPSLA